MGNAGELARENEALRLRDFHSYTRSLGLPEFRPPMAVSSHLPFLAAPLRHRDEAIGAIYVGEKEREFTAGDEETLVMFASPGGAGHRQRPPAPG